MNQKECERKQLCDVWWCYIAFCPKEIGEATKFVQTHKHLPIKVPSFSLKSQHDTVGINTLPHLLLHTLYLREHTFVLQYMCIHLWLGALQSNHSQSCKYIKQRHLTYLLTYLLAYSMVQDIIWELIVTQLVKKYPFLWNPTVHHRIHKIPPLDQNNTIVNRKTVSSTKEIFHWNNRSCQINSKIVPKVSFNWSMFRVWNRRNKIREKYSHRPRTFNKLDRWVQFTAQPS
jgi:hypothetical protein